MGNIKNFSNQLIKMKENIKNDDNLYEENYFLNTTINLAQELREKLSLSDIVKIILANLYKIYKNQKLSFYFFDYNNDIIQSFWLEEEEIKTKIIVLEKLIQRLRNITKPCIKKRSIFQRKNTLTFYFPFKISKLYGYIIEIPLGNSMIELKEIKKNLEKINAVIVLSIRNAILFEQLEFNNKETTRILNCNPSGIASVNSKGKIQFANQMFEMMTGYSLAELHESDIIINHIFPDFTFVIFENRPIEGRIFNIRRKDNFEFPCLVSIVQVTEDDEITHIITLTDDSYNIKQKEKIVNIRRTIANDDSVGVVLFRFASLGGEIVIEDLRNFKIYPEYFSTVFYTSIGQGNRHAKGVYGPIPAPKLKNFNAIIFAFTGRDDAEIDYRMDRNQYYLLAVIFPKDKTEFLVSNKKIEKRFLDLIQDYEYPNRMNKNDLTKFREIVFID